MRRRGESEDERYSSDDYDDDLLAGIGPDENKYLSVLLPMDSELNVFSERFNPARALKDGLGSHFNVMPLDNVSMCRMLLPSADLGRIKDQHERSVLSRKRRRLTAEERKELFGLNAVEKLTEKYAVGPLNVLYRAVREKMRVRAQIRKINGIRGHCDGTVLVFDKHMNMIMCNVNEVYFSHTSAPTLGNSRSESDVGFKERSRYGESYLFTVLSEAGKEVFSDTYLCIYN